MIAKLKEVKPAVMGKTIKATEITVTIPDEMLESFFSSVYTMRESQLAGDEKIYKTLVYAMDVFGVSKLFHEWEDDGKWQRQ